MVHEWQALNGRAWLRLPCCGAEHPTRVEDFVGDDCVIAAPIAPHHYLVDPLEKKEGFFFGWVNKSRGALEVPVLLANHTLDPMPTWTLHAIGEAVETQRRAYVRLTTKLDVKLYLLERGAPSKAVTLDVSEGGMRCVVDSWANDPGPRAFKVEFEFEGKVNMLDGQIAWWGNLENDDSRIVGIKFLDVPQRVADSIRSYIFAAQLEERRRRLA